MQLLRVIDCSQMRALLISCTDSRLKTGKQSFRSSNWL